MKRKTILLMVLIFCIISSSAMAETIIVRLRDVFPVSFKTGDKWQGMDIDVLDLVLSRAGLKYEIVDLPLKRSLIKMESGQVHIMANLTKNDERSVFMHWIGPVRNTGIALIVLKENKDLQIKNSDDLVKISKAKGKYFGDTIGASYSDFFDNRLKNDPAFKDIFEYVPVNTQNHTKLAANRILGFFLDDFEAKFLINQSQKAGDNVLFDNFALHQYRIEESVSGAYIGISKKLDRQTTEKIVKAYQSILDDGSFNKIYFK